MDQTHHSDHSDYNKHAGHKTSSFLTKFWIALVATIPIFFYSDMAVMIFNIQAPQFLGSRYIWLVVGSFIFWYCGWVFLASAYRELRAKLPGMMTLIAIAISAAYFFSVFVILSGREGDLLFELSSLITIMLLGHWIEMKSVQGAQGALKELAKLLPDQAEVIRGDKTEIIPLSELRVGDCLSTCLRFGCTFSSGRRASYAGNYFRASHRRSVHEYFYSDCSV